MKLKYYLRGLGVGVICTAIIMGIALSGNKKETLTDAEIIERARLLGMVMEEEAGSGKEDFQQERDGQGEAPEEGAESGSEKGSKTQDGQPDKEKSEDDGKEEKSGEQPDTAAQDPENVGSNASNNENGIVELEIKQGEFSDVVSKKLFQAGLIPDADKFNAYMTQKGVDDSLRVGVHLIPVDATADEIIEILQEKPQ